MTETVAVDRDRRAKAAGLDPAQLPRHVAIIMDGNGRWAKSRGWVRTRGHRQGADNVRMVTTESAALGIERLTLYAFSSENWSRPQREIDFLMKLLNEYLDQELATLHENRIRFTTIGQICALPTKAQQLIARNVAETAAYDGMTLCLALSYGGRQELVDACKQIAERVAAGHLDLAEINEATIGRYLYAPDAGDVDLVIRTANEHRLSNFLTWQTVYAEYIALAPLWPEFSAEDYFSALREYQGRERRFGRVIQG